MTGSVQKLPVISCTETATWVSCLLDYSPHKVILSFNDLYFIRSYHDCYLIPTQDPESYHDLWRALKNSMKHLPWNTTHSPEFIRLRGSLPNSHISPFDALFAALPKDTKTSLPHMSCRKAAEILFTKVGQKGLILNPPSAKLVYGTPLNQYNHYIFRFLVRKAFIQVATYVV